MASNVRKTGAGWYIFLSVFSILVVWTLLGCVKHAFHSPKDYLFLGIGVLVYFLVDRFIYAAPSFIKTLSHEVSHMVVCWFFFQKVTTLNVKENSGVVWHESRGRISASFITLAPYCLPLVSYVLLLIRVIIVPNFYWLIDLLIGLSVAFYIQTFNHDTSSHQTDINQYSHRLFPYWFIYAFRAFNAIIIVMSLLPHMNVFKSFYFFFQESVSFFAHLF